MDGGQKAVAIYIFSGDPTQELWNIPARGSATSNDEEVLEYIAGLILRNDCQALIINEEKDNILPGERQGRHGRSCDCCGHHSRQSLNTHQVSIGTVASTPSLFGNRASYPSRVST